MHFRQCPTGSPIFSFGCFADHGASGLADHRASRAQVFGRSVRRRGRSGLGSTNLQRKSPVREITYTTQAFIQKAMAVAELLLLGGLVATIALNYDPR